MAKLRQGNQGIAAAWRWIAGVALLGSVLGMNAYGDAKFASGNSRAHLLELYTSEGCSSCPPADRWLGTLQSSPLLWSQFVPVAFHVDYWDYLGWRDAYARAEFSARQQRYARLQQVRGVYTPGMFLDGEEWREWQAANVLERGKVVDSAAVGELTLSYDRQHSSVTFVAAPGAQQLPSKAYLALLGVSIDSPIKAGENRGKSLRHDFVVLDLVSADLTRGTDGLVASLPAITTSLTAPRYAVAAWVTNSNDSKPLQATGGWLQSDKR